MLKASTYANASVASSLDTPSEADAGLVDICAGWIARWSKNQAASEADSNFVRSDAEFEQDRADRLAICETRAATLSGLRAKSQVCACLDYDCPDLVSSMCGDLALLKSL